MGASWSSIQVLNISNCDLLHKLSPVWFYFATKTVLVVYDNWLIWKVQKRTTSQHYVKQEDWKGKAGRLWKQPPQFAIWYTHPPPVWWQSPSYIILQARFGNLGRRWMSRGRSQPTMVVATSIGFVQGKMGSAGDWMVRGSSTTRSAFWPPLPPNPPSLLGTYFWALFYHFLYK